MKMRNMAIMHRKYLALEQYHCNFSSRAIPTATTITVTITTITVGVTAESAVTPTVIVAHHALSPDSPAVIDSDSKQSLQEEEERPRVAQAQDYLCF